VYVGGGRSKWYGGFASRREAEGYRARLAVHPSHAAGVGLYGSSRLRVRVFADKWLQAKNRRPKTLENYRWVLDQHILPTIGDLPISKVGPLAIESLLTNLREKGLAPATVRLVWRVVHALLAEATQKEITSQNPCDRVDAPPNEGREIRVFDEEQTRLFLGAAKKTHYAALYSFLLLTGCRVGEAFGLRWSDVNLTFGTATIQQTIQRINGQVVPGEPKTKTGRRTITLPSVLIEDLRLLRERNPHELVFCGRAGRPLHISTVRRAFFRILTRAGLPRIRLHDLRHLSAALLIAVDIHPKALQARLGHSSITVTLDTYGHLLRGVEEKAVRDMEARLFGATDLQPNSGIAT